MITPLRPVSKFFHDFLHCDIFTVNIRSETAAKSVWWHYLVVIVPDNLKHTQNASLYVTGGGNDNSPPTKQNEDILVAVTLSVTTGIITGSLFQVTTVVYAIYILLTNITQLGPERAHHFFV